MKPEKPTAVIILVVIGIAFLSLTNRDTYIFQLINKINDYYTHFPEEKAYLHIDKEAYKPGENIWFRAYVTDPSNNQPSTLSKSLSILLVNAEGIEVIHDRFSVEDGCVKGSVKLFNNHEIGDYKLIAFTSWMENLGSREAFCKDIIVRNIFPPNYAILVSLDDSIYLPGEKVRAEILIVSTMGNSIIGQFNYKSGSFEKTIKQGKAKTDSTGKASIEFQLPKKLTASPVTLTISANILNSPEETSILIPTRLQEINLHFFPEGGELIEGIESGIACMVTDDFGRTCNFGGEIFNRNGEKIIEVNSTYNGTGTARLIPFIDDSLYMILISPEGIDKRYYLPEPLKQGFSVSVNENTKDFVTIEIKTSEDLRNEDLYLIGIHGNKVYWTTPDPFQGDTLIYMPTNNFPQGIVQLTLFDRNFIPRAERLVFVNKRSRMDIHVTSEKEIYNPREKVLLRLEATDEFGFPVSGNFSLSVVEENKLNTAGEKQNILTHLLLSSEIRGDISNPEFYLLNTDKSDKALDLLLLTQGWRRFKWQEILAFPDIDQIPYRNQDILRGKVVTQRGKRLPEAKVIILKTKGDWECYETLTDETGEFEFPTEVYQRVMNGEFIIKAESPRGIEKLIIEFDKDFSEKAIDFYVFNRIEEERSAIPGEEIAEARTNMPSRFREPVAPDKYILNISQGTILLEEVVVKEKKPIDVTIPGEEYRRMYMEQKKKGDDIKDRSLTLVQLIRSIAPAFQVVNDRILFRGPNAWYPGQQKGALIVVDELHKYERISQARDLVNIVDIHEIKVTTNPGAALKYTGQQMGGLIEITTKGNPEVLRKLGETDEVREKQVDLVTGFVISREFYSPDYDSETEDSLPKPDLRSTIYWNHDVKTDNTGVATISFHNSDIKSPMKVVVEGISREGLIGTASYRYQVRADSIPVILNMN